MQRQRSRSWRYLAMAFAGFWLLFATILIISNFPFLIISMALTTLAVLSCLVLALAWAYQHDW